MTHLFLHACPCRNGGYIRTPTRVIGTYYFDEFLWSHPWFHLPSPHKFQSLLSCLPGHKRTAQVPQASTLGESGRIQVQRYHAAVIHREGHLLVRDEESGLLTKLKVMKVLRMFTSYVDYLGQ